MQSCNALILHLLRFSQIQRPPEKRICIFRKLKFFLGDVQKIGV